MNIVVIIIRMRGHVRRISCSSWWKRRRWWVWIWGSCYRSGKWWWGRRM